MRRTDRFVQMLQKLDRQAHAKLRRSLSFEPATYPQAYPYVEPFATRDLDRRWFYLVAGLFALHQQGGAPTAPDQDISERKSRSLGQAVASLYDKRDRSASIEHRFIALLDADTEQLPHRLRQMISLLRAEEVEVDWPRLLDDLLHWEHEQRYVQQNWARDFYGGSEPASPESGNTQGGNDE